MHSKRDISPQQNTQYQLPIYRHNPKTQVAHVNDLRKPKAPKYSFGRSTRDQQPKRYVTKEITNTDNFGKWTSMGYYTPRDNCSYSKSPSWKMPSTAKLKTQAHYDYYQHQNDPVDIRTADANRRPKSARTYFGNEQRFKQKSGQSPGPQYYPQAQITKKEPLYSIGVRRSVKGFDPFKPLQSSNQKVGPGAYKPEKSPLTATHHNSPKWSIPRSPKMTKTAANTVHETYDVSSAMGLQKLSGKSSQPKLSINKTSRESKGLIMKAHMEFRPMQVRIAHPHF